MKPVTLAIIGDSAASGVGDSNEVGVNFGWGYYLAQSFENPLVFINVARPGAQSFEVLQTQLPRVQLHNPDICAVIVGGNDLLRNGFDPERLHKNLRKTVRALIALEFRKLISEFGFQIAEIEVDHEIKRCKKKSVLWMLRNGTPWFLKRSIDLLPAALILMLIEGVRSFISRKSNQVGADLLTPNFIKYQDLELTEISEVKIS